MDDVDDPSGMQPDNSGAANGRAESDRHGWLCAWNISVSYGHRQVVSDASLAIRRGEAVGLLGPNGAGKTTLFYTVAGMLRPDRGMIELDGADITALPMYRRARLGIGYLPQEASIFRDLSVEDNIRAILQLSSSSREAQARELENLLAEFDIARIRHSPAVSVSGGERRRCEIARALASRPSYILLDEPFAGVDPIAVGEIRGLVRQLTQRGIGVLVTDHNVRETLGLVDRAYIINSGVLIAHGTPEAIVADEAVKRSYLGEGFVL